MFGFASLAQILKTDRFQQPVFNMVVLFPRWRNYSKDYLGRKVLIGLTIAETREFELLDAESSVDEHGQLFRWETDDRSFPPNQARWLELYKKHQAACARLDDD
jgi:hypothetical protein